MGHLDRPVTVDELAARAGMSPRTFARRFRAETGTTPHDWLTNQRVLLARRLLEETGLSVEAVADRAGFGDAAALRHHFARRVGATPHGYRTTFRDRVRPEPRPATSDRGRRRVEGTPAAVSSRAPHRRPGAPSRPPSRRPGTPERLPVPEDRGLVGDGDLVAPGAQPRDQAGARRAPGSARPAGSGRRASTSGGRRARPADRGRVDGRGDELDVPLRLHVPTHHPERPDRCAVAGQEARDDRVEGPLGRPDHVGMARIEPEAGAPVLQGEAVPGQHHPRTEPQVGGLDQADHQAVGVGRAEIDGAAPLRVTGHRVTGPVGEQRPPRRQVARIEQAGRRHGGALRVGHVRVRVGEAELDRLHLPVHPLPGSAAGSRPSRTPSACSAASPCPGGGNSHTSCPR